VTAVAAAPRVVLRPVRLRPRWLLVGFAAVLVALVLGLTIGAVSISPRGAILEVVDRLPFVSVHTGLTEREAEIVWNLRLPRVVLGLQVGAMLAVAGASYQGVFRNPLADPYLLGAAAGAGLAVTLVIVNGVSANGPAMLDPVPLAAFVGAVGAVLLAYAVGAAGTRGRSPATLVPAGVAVTSFLTAGQTYVQQRDSETIREVYTWILGRLTTAGWSDVALLAPYFVVTTVVLLAHRRVLDVLSVGDQEATALGLHAARVRIAVVIAASLATAAAVSVSGLIAFVGIIVPHTVRLVAGTSYRIVLPLSVLFGAAFLALADLLARTLSAPAELPIGVITAFFGAPFFVMLLRTSRTVQ
jgi:iron complex transport system permease protein